MPSCFEDRIRQQRVVAIAGPTMVGWAMPVVMEQAPLGATTTGTFEPTRMQMAFQPEQTDAIIQVFADRNVNHMSMIPRFARWLDMSPVALSGGRCQGWKLGISHFGMELAKVT